MDATLRFSLLTAALMVGSATLDALAFSYSAGIWRDGRLVWSELAKSAVLFACGISLYFWSVRYMGAVGVNFPEIQTLIWFAVTIVVVTVLGGRFLSLSLLDQLIAINALFSLGWLIVRTSA